MSSAAYTLLRNKSVGDILNQNHDFIEIDWEHHIQKMRLDSVCIGAKDFHRKCGNFKNTLVVIKSTEGNVLGEFQNELYFPNLLKKFEFDFFPVNYTSPILSFVLFSILF